MHAVAAAGTPAAVVATGVLFDVDGTLVDTNYLHTLAWWRSLHDVGIDIAASRIHRLIGMNSQRLVTELLGRPDDDVIEGHSRHFGQLKREIRAFPQAGALLGAVHERGALVVLATSAKSSDVGDMLAVVDAPPGCIDSVTDSGAGVPSKPEPDIFHVALEASGLEPERALVVGDTVWDVEAARRCGLGCIAVLSGGNSRRVLDEAGAIAVYDDVAQVLADLDRSPLGELLASGRAPRGRGVRPR